MLNTVLNYSPKTLQDLGLKERASKAVLSSLLAEWSHLNPMMNTDSKASDESGPFRDQLINKLWIAKAEDTV